MRDALRRAFEAEPDVAYALLFGSAARGTAHRHSDVDIALGLSPGAARDVTRLGDLMARLSRAAGRPVDVVLLDEAGPALAYRVFREGDVLAVRDRDAFVKRKARAILDYLDFKPVEERCIAGVLRATASRGR